MLRAACLFAVILLPAAHLHAVDFIPIMSVPDNTSAWSDYNFDGFPDLFAGTTFLTNNYHIDPNTPFIEHPGAVPGMANTFNTSVGDYNNDGNLDIFGYRMGELGPGGGELKIATGDGAGNWVDDSAKALPTSVSDDAVNRDHIIVDLNNDGFLDVYITSWVFDWPDNASESFAPDTDIIYTNNAGNTFSHTWTSPINRYGKGVVHSDFDRDGDQDVYVSNYWLDQGFLWRNDGFDGSSGLSEQAANYNLYDGPGHTQGSSFGDFNNDGHQDLFISNFAHPGNPQLRFMENQGPAGNYNFTNRGTGGLRQLEPQNSGIPVDFDNDGDLDIFLTVDAGYGAEKNKLYRNDGNFTFTNVTRTYALHDVRQSNQGANFRAAWGDYDNDGFLDLFADSRLWKNPGAQNWPDNHFLKLKLNGGQGANGLVNQSAIGAQARITIPGLGTLTREVQGGIGQGMQNDLALHFGLGTWDQPVDVEIFWPDGTIQNLLDVDVDQFLAVNILDPVTSSAIIPEPRSITLLAAGLILLRPRRRRR